MNVFRRLLSNKEGKNAIWLIGGGVAQKLLAFLIGLWSVKEFGREGYGLLTYVAALITFFTSLSTLGITASIFIKELTDKPDEEGKTLGTTLVLRIISSFLSAVTVIGIVIIVDYDEPITIWMAVLSSTALVFQALDIFEFWFQKRYLSKVKTIATLTAYIVTSLYKIFILATGKDAVFFAASNSVDYIVMAIVLYAIYKKYDGPKLEFSWKRGKEILSKSYPFILSGMMVAVYGETDKFMLKQMLSPEIVTDYSLAASLSTMWVFVLTAIIASFAPTIVRYKKEGMEKEYEEKNIQLYSVIFYISMAVSVFFTVFAPLIIQILYGEGNMYSVQPLRVITWYVAFSYLGCARDTWMICENKQKYSTYMYFFAAVLNVGMNFLLIPSLGATGAALASLVTQILACLILPMLWKGMKPNVKLMIMGMNPKVIKKLISGK